MKGFRWFPCLLVLLLASPGVLLAAREWPDDPKAIVSSFGNPADGVFSRGISFRSGGQRVNAWSDGEVIWTSGPSPASNAPPGRGLVVVEHEGGFRTAYRGIEQRPDLDIIVSRGEWLGYADGTDWSFEIRDTRRSRIVDPLSLLPSRTGLPAPSPGQVELLRGDSILAVREGLELSPGLWDILVKDVLVGSGRAISTEISLYWVGVRVGSLRFDALAESESESALVLETPDPEAFSRIFDADGQIRFPGVLLSAGRGTLELRIKDESGRVLTRSWNLNVR